MSPIALQESKSSIATSELSITTLQQLAEIGRIIVRSPIYIKMLAVEGTAPNGRASFGLEADRRIKAVWIDPHGNPEKP